MRRIHLAHGRWAVAAAAAGIVWLAPQAEAASIQLYGPTTPDARLQNIVSGPDGSIWFTDDNHQIGRVTTAGQVTEFPTPVGQNETTTGQGPADLIASGGALWFTSSVGEYLYRVTTDGHVTQVRDNLSYNLGSIAPSSDGGVWATMENHTGLLRFNPDGTFRTQIASGNGNLSPMTAGPAGSVWYADHGASLLSQDDAGDPAHSYPIAPLKGDSEVTSLAFDGPGDLWWTSSTLDSQFLGAMDGAVGELRAGASTAAPVAYLPDSDIPFGVARGPDGAMWFGWYRPPGLPKGGGIGRLDPATGAIQLLDTLNQSAVSPSAIAFGSDGALWFLDASHGKIGRIALDQPLFAAPAGPPQQGAAPGVTPPRQTAPKLTVSVPRARLSRVRRTRHLTVRCSLAAAGRCAAHATITPSLARSLRLHVAKHATAVTVATASTRTLTRKGTATLTLRLSKRTAAALSRRRSINLQLVVTSSSPGRTTVTVRRKLTLTH